jgi:hypothetical protein
MIFDMSQLDMTPTDIISRLSLPCGYHFWAMRCTSLAMYHFLSGLPVAQCFSSLTVGEIHSSRAWNYASLLLSGGCAVELSVSRLFWRFRIVRFFWGFIFVQSLKFVYRWLASEVVLGLGFSYRGTFRMTQKTKLPKMSVLYLAVLIPDSSVGSVTTLRAGRCRNRGLDSPRGNRVFPFLDSHQTGLRYVPTLFPGDKAVGTWIWAVTSIYCGG